jgi:hypothetical protein
MQRKMAIARMETRMATATLRSRIVANPGFALRQRRFLLLVK